MPDAATRPVVVDGDGHVVEPPDLWTARMDRDKWGDLIPHLVMEEGAMYYGGVSRGGAATLTKIAEARGMTLEELGSITASLQHPGGPDPVARLEEMDAAGMDAAVLYATSALFFGPVDPIETMRNPEFVADCQRAYNDWLAEYCSAAPDRLFGIAAVPLQDPALAVAEAERAVNKLGLKGVFIRPAPYLGDELPFSHPEYDRFWAAMQDLDVPVSFHPGVHVDTPGACRKFKLVQDSESLAVTNSDVSPIYGGSGFGQAIGNAVDMITSMGRVIMGGVCERFPRLNFIFLESGGGWCATQLERMDEQVELFWLERQWLTMLPSEYFKRQCYISFDPGEWNLAASAEYIGADRIIWASDFPHPEYRRDVVGELRKNIASLGEADQRKILGETAIAAYRLPVKAAV